MNRFSDTINLNRVYTKYKEIVTNKTIKEWIERDLLSITEEHTEITITTQYKSLTGKIFKYVIPNKISGITFKNTLLLTDVLNTDFGVVVRFLKERKNINRLIIFSHFGHRSIRYSSEVRLLETMVNEITKFVNDPEHGRKIKCILSFKCKYIDFDPSIFKYYNFKDSYNVFIDDLTEATYSIKDKRIMIYTHDDKRITPIIIYPEGDESK